MHCFKIGDRKKSILSFEKHPLCNSSSNISRNKSGTVQVDAPLKVQKEHVLNMQRNTIVKNFCQTYNAR